MTWAMEMENRRAKAGSCRKRGNYCIDALLKHSSMTIVIEAPEEHAR